MNREPPTPEEKLKMLDEIREDLANRLLPTPEQRLFGQEKYNIGYSKGYQRAFWDLRKIKLKKEGKAFRRFGKMWDRMEDQLSENRKR